MIHMMRTTSWVLFLRSVFCGRSQVAVLVYPRLHAKHDKVACGAEEHGREDKLDDPEGYEYFLKPWRILSLISSPSRHRLGARGSSGEGRRVEVKR